MADNLPIGKLIEGDAARDAIHVAVAPVVAAEKLAPGQHIGFVEGSTERVESVVGAAEKHRRIGIVDPFLLTLVFPEQRFWMFLYPQTITSLRHDWSHPAFGASPPPNAAVSAQEAARKAIEEFGHQVGLSYDGVLQAAAEYVEHGEYIHRGEDESYKDADWDSLWPAYETVTGQKVGADERGWFFSCSC